MVQLKSFLDKNRIEAGCDEAGRGCLAGPVTAAAVILPDGFFHPLLNDSKKMTEGQRNEVRAFIEAHALSWAVAFIDNIEIDRINILKASIAAMHRALKKLTMQPQYILVDGNRFVQYKNISHQCIIKGDAKFSSIAAASVLAKTHRDDYMKKICLQHPQYEWDKNKGYPTPDHRKAISEHGVTPFHRMSFRLLKHPDSQLNIF